MEKGQEADMACSLWGLHSLVVTVRASEQVRDLNVVDRAGLERLAQALVTCLTPSQIMELLIRLEDEFRMMVLRRSYQEGAENQMVTLALLDPNNPTVTTRYVSSREEGEAILRSIGTGTGATATSAPDIAAQDLVGPDLELDPGPTGWDEEDGGDPLSGG